jgi:N-acyl-D-aspartate/D-glutamate deacylase
MRSQASIDWQWASYGDYLAAMDRCGLEINVGTLVPMRPLHHDVPGEASFERPATPEEMAPVRSLLREAQHAGCGARLPDCRDARQE